MENYLQYTEPSNTTLSIKAAVLLGFFVTFATVLGVAHGKHTEKTASKLESHSIHNVIKIGRREDYLQ